jgi:putative ABC transport system permease protein
VQLAVVAAALRGAFAYPPAAAGIVTVMFVVAVATASRRISAHARATRAVTLACGSGAVVVVGLVVGLPILQRDVRDLVAVAGIIIGGCMTAATLTGRRLADGMIRRRDEIEAWFALGATSRQAVRDVARSAVIEAMVPALDQTRTVGLVTLPGAFIGALLGGADATTAARFQVTVLIGLLCAEALTAVVLVQLLGAPAHLPEEPAQ